MTPEAIHQLLLEASALHRERQYEAAIAIYDRVLVADPGNTDALSFLASAFRSTGRLGEAVALYERIAETEPQRAEFWFNRANALTDVGRHEEAVDSYSRSLAMEPGKAAVLANLAIAEAKLGHAGTAIETYRKALAIEPDHKIAAHNLGNLLAEQGQFDEAARYLRQTVRNWPDMPEGHYNLALILLRLGDFANGFLEYEWRWDTADFFKKPGYRDVPVWMGQKLAGKRLLVHSEQGLGDTIQFSKLLGLLASLGGDIVYHVPEKLERLLKSLPYPVTVTHAHGASDADFQIPILSLPHRLKLTLGSVPSAPSFLSAEPARVLEWADRLALDGSRPAIGFVWQGNPNSPAERGRSLSSAEELAPFAALSGVRLVALQKLPVEALETADNASGWRVRGLSFMLEHPGPDMDEGADAFIDTAAIMAGLDLVVSVCTAPLHLAGALGRPAIALLKPVPDWRWLMDVGDTPWYPNMRLVRQPRGETFGPAIARAVELARSTLA